MAFHFQYDAHFWFLQLEVEALKLYTTTISNLKFTVRKVHDFMTLEEYIWH